MNCLVIVDMQKGFMNSETEHLKSKLVDFLNENGSKFDYIVATRYVNHEGTPCQKFENWCGCMVGSGEEELIDELPKDMVDYIFDKDVYSCYTGKFPTIIQSWGIDKIYYVGVNTGCCVLHSAFDSYNDLIESFVIEDLCGSTSGKHSHECAIQVLKECITKERVIKSSDI